MKYEMHSFHKIKNKAIIAQRRLLVSVNELLKEEFV